MQPNYYAPRQNLEQYSTKKIYTTRNEIIFLKKLLTNYGSLYFEAKPLFSEILYLQIKLPVLRYLSNEPTDTFTLAQHQINYDKTRSQLVAIHNDYNDSNISTELNASMIKSLHNTAHKSTHHCSITVGVRAAVLGRQHDHFLLS